MKIYALCIFGVITFGHASLNKQNKQNGICKYILLDLKV